MSSQKFVAPLQLDVLSSRILVFVFFVFHALAIVTLFFLALPLIVLFVLGLLLLYNLLRSIYQHAMCRAKKSIVRIIWEDNGKWYIVRRSGEKVRVEFQGDSFVSPWLTVLNFKVPEKWFSQSVILSSDNVNMEAHRRLRVRLKTTPHHLFE